MLELKFSYNWNNKLNCECFSTIRVWNVVKYQIGQVYTVTLNGKSLGTATLVAGNAFAISKLTEGMARLDTGYDKAGCEGVLRGMYKDYCSKHRGDAKFGFYIFKWVDKQSELFGA